MAPDKILPMSRFEILEEKSSWFNREGQREVMLAFFGMIGL